MPRDLPATSEDRASLAKKTAPLADLVNIIADLPPELVPTITLTGVGTVPPQRRGRRLAIVGDVHGQRAVLEELLDKVGFNRATDHLVLTGDLINKGPDSPGVVALAMKLGASAVRGNHEDRVLLCPDSSGKAAKRPPASRGHKTDRDTAASLSAAQRAWLSSLPVILRIRALPGLAPGGLLVVHAGLVPGVALHHQDPLAVMTMRSLVPSAGSDVLLPVDSRDGEPWPDAWNRYQKGLPEDRRVAVVYGHDSKKGLCIAPGDTYTFGLDSGCGKGESLSCMVIEAGEKEAKWHIVQVQCQNKGVKGGPT